MKYNTINACRAHVLKITFALILCLTTQYIAAQNALLDKKVTISFKNETLTVVITKIEEQTNCSFSYTASIFKTNRLVTKNYVNEPLREVLNDLFVKNQIYYRVRGNTIHLQNNTEKVQVSGKLTTVDNNPAPFVTVALQGTNFGATSDENGYFSFYAPEGEYIILTSSNDLKRQKQSISIEANKNNKVNFTLSETSEALQEVVVNNNGKINKFSRLTSVNAAKIPLKKLENPQVYSSVSKELIQDQFVVVYSDILKNVPGVNLQLQNNSNSPGGNVSSRGFSGGAFIRNGVPGMNVGILDPVNIETLEALKGPSGTLFGGGLTTSFGGTFNRVTKKPLDTFQALVGYSGGSFELSRISADVNTPINADKTILFRVTGAKHYDGSFQDAGFQDYIFISPSLTYKINEKFTVNIDGEFMKGKFNNFYRFFPDARDATGVHSPDELNFDFDRRFIGNDIYEDLSTNSFYAQADYKISDKWKSVTNFSYSTTSGNGLYGSLMAKPGNIELTTNMSNTEYGRNTLADIQQNFIGDIEILDMKHRVLIGIDYLNTQGKSSSASLIFNTLNMADPGADYGTLTRSALLDRFSTAVFAKNSTKNTTYSIYAQDVINITDKLIALAGIRADRFINEGIFNIVTSATAGKYNQTVFSPRFGLIYQPLKDKISLFGNYMNGFRNVAPVTQPDASVSVFDPQQANQLEGGVKLNLIDGRLSSTISYYDIKVKDIVRADPDRAGYSIQNGEQYSKGFETEIIYNPIMGLNIVAGYASNKSKMVNSATNVQGLRPSSAGPETMVNSWISYRISTGKLNGLGFGFGGNYASKNYVNLTTASSFILPSYTVLNSSIFYEQTKYRIGLKMNNFTNEKYYIGWSTVIPQMPSNFILDLVIKF